MLNLEMKKQKELVRQGTGETGGAEGEDPQQSQRKKPGIWSRRQ